jgi:L-ascorbate metabolism protein UlaG (beta-lactamase superfamily)
MKKPALQDEAFLADVADARLERDRLHIWWLGQSGFLVLWQDSFLLLDPYLSDSLTKKYARTNKPHVRLTERVIAPEKLDFVTVVTSSHNHTDHLDAETIRPLLTANPNLTILVPAANLTFAAERLQVAPERLTTVVCGQPQIIGQWRFHAVPAAHEELAVDENGNHRFIGLVVEVGPWTIYHSGDTVRYAGMREWLRPFTIDVAMLPINGRDPSRGVAGNLSGSEAVQLAQECGIKEIIPCHFDMFEFNTVTPDAFVVAAERTGQAYHLLQNGGRWSLLPGDGKR